MSFPSVFQKFVGGDRLAHFLGARADLENAAGPVEPVHFGIAYVAQVTVDLDGLVQHE